MAIVPVGSRKRCQRDRGEVVSIETRHRRRSLHPRGAVSTREDTGLCRSSAVPSGPATQQPSDHHKIVGYYRGAHEQFEMLATFDERALHPAPSKQYGDATFDAGAESLSALERRALFERFPFGASLPSRLRDARERDTGRLARLDVVFVEEAGIGAIQVGCGIKDRLVAVERRLDMDLVGGISAEHTILRDQPAPALGQEHLVTELHRFEHLPPLDQIRMGFENGVELFLGGHLLAMKDSPARLTDDTGTELAVARDVTPKGVDRDLRGKVETPNAHGSLDDGPRLSDHLLGDPDERAIRAHLLTVSLPCRHALNLLHPAPSAARAVRERPDARREQGVQLANEPRQDAHRIPQQRVIGGMMNIECRAYCYAELSSERWPDSPSCLKL